MNDKTKRQLNSEIQDLFLEFLELKDELTQSDLQGVAQANASQIIKFMEANK